MNRDNQNAGLLQSVILSHLLCAEVGVAAGTVPVPWDGFGVKGRDHTEILTNSVKDEASDPQMVAHVDPFTRSHLELPLEHNNQTMMSSNHSNFFHHVSIFMSFMLFFLQKQKMTRRHESGAVKIQSG